MNCIQKVLKRASTFLIALFISLAYFVPLVNVGANTSYPGVGTPQTLSAQNPAPTATINARVASTDGDTLRAYRVINVTYSAATNDFTEIFSSSFQAYLTSISSTMTVSDYYNFTTDSSDLKSCLAGFATYVKTTGQGGQANSDYYETISDSYGVAKFTGVPMGQYLILGWGNTAGPRVYSTATAEVVPEVSGSNYVLYTIYNVDLKTTEPSIGKVIQSGTVNNAGKQSANIGDTISYQIDTSVPTYPLNATATQFEIGDTLSAGLTLNENSIVVSVPSGSDYIPLTNTAEHTYYSISCPGNPYTFKVTFTHSEIKIYSSVRVTYTATLNQNAKVGENGQITDQNTNTATLLYSSDPFNNSFSYPLDSPPVVVYTYGLMINKFVGTTQANRLAGAQFKIYKDSNCATAVQSGGSDVILTTDTDGFAFYKGLRSGTYYLKEIVAPTGYNLLDNAKEFSVGGSGPLITSCEGQYLKSYTSVYVDNESTPRATQGSDYGWIDTLGNLVWSASESTAPSEGAVKAYVKNSISAGSTVASFGSYSGSNGFWWTDVSNAQGVILPSTGGIGTTIFTVVGLILVVGAAVLLITKARIANKRKS